MALTTLRIDSQYGLRAADRLPSTSIAIGLVSCLVIETSLALLIIHNSTSSIGTGRHPYSSISSISGLCFNSFCRAESTHSSRNLNYVCNHSSFRRSQLTSYGSLHQQKVTFFTAKLILHSFKGTRYDYRVACF